MASAGGRKGAHPGFCHTNPHFNTGAGAGRCACAARHRAAAGSQCARPGIGCVRKSTSTALAGATIGDRQLVSPRLARKPTPISVNPGSGVPFDNRTRSAISAYASRYARMIPRSNSFYVVSEMAELAPFAPGRAPGNPTYDFAWEGLWSTICGCA